MNHKLAGRALACLSPLIFVSCLAGCTSYFPAKLVAIRVGDTLSVAIAGDGAARWDMQKDSLVVECPDCATGGSVAVVHFENRNNAWFEIDRAEGLKFTLYSMGHDTLVTIPGEGTPGAGVTPGLRRLPPRYYNPDQEEEEIMERAKQHPQKEFTPTEKPAPKTQSLTVTAPEGVAVYRDKTKKEVLKILPQGSKIILVALEGDFYSVIIDGEEGFVEAEAVKIK